MVNDHFIPCFTSHLSCLLSCVQVPCPTCKGETAPSGWSHHTRYVGKVVDLGSNITITSAMGRKCKGDCFKNGARNVVVYDDDKRVLEILPEYAIETLPFGRDDRDKKGFTCVSRYFSF